MTNRRIQGELQSRIMRALWRLESGTVEQVRRALPKKSRGAYNTVQTVLNRLAERGLVARERRGNVIVYSPKLAEGDYLARSLHEDLEAASADARRAALATLVGELSADELEEIRALTAGLDNRRKT